jgi:hypothetical protein
MDWKSCLYAASKRGAMLYSSIYSVPGGWNTHRNGSAAMVSNWTSYMEFDMLTAQSCIVGRDPAATRDTDVLTDRVHHDGDVWVFQDLGPTYYDLCATAASNAGAMIVSPSVVGSESYLDYWVSSMLMCNTYPYIDGPGSNAMFNNPEEWTRSGVKNCMIGHIE